MMVPVVRKVDSLREAIHIRLQEFLGQNFKEFVEMVEAVRSDSLVCTDSGSLLAFYLEPSDEVAEDDDQTLGLRVRHDVSLAIKEYVVGDSIDLRIEPFKIKEEEGVEEEKSPE